MAHVFSNFFHPEYPSLLSYTHARRTFYRALRTLPPSLHFRVWVAYLLWAERKGGETTTITVYRRYLVIDPSLTECFMGLQPQDLFEQALEKCPPKSCWPLFLMYAQLEEEHGLAKRSMAMAIYNRATQVVNDEDKFEVMCYLFGVSNTSLIASNVCRCSQFTLRKQRRTLVFQLLDPSMNVPWKVRFIPWL